MTRKEAIECNKNLKMYMKLADENQPCKFLEENYIALDIAIKALEQEPCEDAISRQAVEDKLLKLCNELEGIFANIRMQNQDESVCGLCEYDCPAPYECPGFDIEDCFKLADEIRHKWQSTKDLPSVNPQEPKWIPVSERLPEDGTYLVTVERIVGELGIDMKSFAKDLNRVDEYDFPKHKCGWYDYDSEYGYWEDTGIIAWMPLPKPYKAESEEV